MRNEATSLPIDTKQLRNCICPPLPKISDAARYLDAAVTAHLDGQTALAEQLIVAANMPEIRKWLKAIWADSSVHVRFPSAQSTVTDVTRAKERMPSKALKLQIHERDGYNCRFCGMPVIRPDTRARIRVAYPRALSWGPKELDQHAAFQAMWAQYDHLVPHANGGTNDLNNLVLACAACNFGRGGYTLAEVGVLDPRSRTPATSSWDGLERFR